MGTGQGAPHCQDTGCALSRLNCARVTPQTVLTRGIRASPAPPSGPLSPDGTSPDPATVFMALKPMSAILSGAPEDGSILFRVDKTLGDNCPMTGLTLTPFGIKQIAVQWEDTFCGGGYMVLSKVR